jgi:hypothetical protein
VVRRGQQQRQHRVARDVVDAESVARRARRVPDAQHLDKQVHAVSSTLLGVTVVAIERSSKAKISTELYKVHEHVWLLV